LPRRSVSFLPHLLASDFIAAIFRFLLNSVQV